MGYRELLDALAEEVRRQAREIRSQAELDAARIREEAVRDARVSLESALAEARRSLELERSALLDPLQREAANALLHARRAALDALHAAATRSLARLDAPAVFERLLDEIAPELRKGVELRVNPALVETARESLAARGLEDIASVDGDPSVRGAGVVALSSGGRSRLDDSLDSRLRVAWTLLEGEIAEKLFREEGRA